MRERREVWSALDGSRHRRFRSTMRSVETVLFLVALPTVVVTPEIVSLVVLPPLLFAAGEELPWRDLRAVWRPVTVLSVGLVLVSAGAVALVVEAITPLSWG